MTNDQPLSRRAARLAQQAAQGEAQQHDAAQPAPLQPAVPSSASFAASRPSASDAIDYRTEVRPRVPRYEPAPLGSAPEPVGSSPLAPPFAPPTAPAPEREVRSRDFRPRGDRASMSFAPAQPDDAALDYRTQGGPLDLGGASAHSSHSAAAASASAASAPAPVGSAAWGSAPRGSAPVGSAPFAPSTASVSLDSPEFTMTRRELRALRDAQALQRGESRPSNEPAADAPSEAATGAPAEPRPPVEPESVEQQPEPEPAQPEPAIDPFEALLSSRPSAEDAADDDSTGLAAADSDTTAADEQPEPAPLHLWQPTSSGSATPAPLIEPSLLAGDDVAAPAPSTATGSHWSAGFSEPADDPFENTFSREVGSASLSTNALVLPEMPTGSLTGPVPGTGEIIITGMVEVPASIASTGAVPSVHDSPDIDELLDAGDREFVSTDSAPVSAINAVSSHTATRNVIAGRKPRGTMLTTVLIVSTVVMAVAAVTIFVVAAANGLF